MQTDDNAFHSMMSGAANMTFASITNGPQPPPVQPPPPQMMEAAAPPPQQPPMTQPPQQPLFGLLIPGHALRTDFIPADPSGLKYTLNLTTPTPDTTAQHQPPIIPTSIPDIAFFLLPTMTLPPNHGVLLYYQATSSTNPNASTGFELIGALTPTKPSGLFRTSWPTHEFFTNADPHTTTFAITLGVSIEPIENIQNLSTANTSIAGIGNGAGTNDRVSMAQKIAMNLYNYMQSFDNNGSGQQQQSGYMTVPVKVFQRWLERFERKCKVDPNFFMKDSSDGS